MALWDFGNWEVNRIGDVKWGLWLFATTVWSIISLSKRFDSMLFCGNGVRTRCLCKGPLFYWIESSVVLTNLNIVPSFCVSHYLVPVQLCYQLVWSHVSCELLTIGMHVRNGGKPTSTLGVEEWSLSLRIKMSVYNILKESFFYTCVAHKLINFDASIKKAVVLYMYM